MNSSMKMQILLVKIYLTGKSNFLQKLGIKTNANNGNESEKEETEEEITLAKALQMADKLKTYYFRKGIADAHSQVSEIEDNIMNFSPKISSSLQ